jgi:hypothetical protein
LGTKQFDLTIFAYFAEMASLPHGAFAVHKLRKTTSEFTISRVPTDMPQPNAGHMSKEDSDVNQALPMKYNDKMMNSIWSNYNRYSPHNIKKISGADQMASVVVQQQ